MEPEDLASIEANENNDKPLHCFYVDNAFSLQHGEIEAARMPQQISAHFAGSLRFMKLKLEVNAAGQ
jgi:hypothetical protein